MPNRQREGDPPKQDFSDLYLKYMKSKAWAKKKEQYWSKFGRKCQVCGSTEQLEVDHLIYARLGNEFLTDLLGLCRTHHRQVTAARRKKKVSSGKGYRKVTENLFQIKIPNSAGVVKLRRAGRAQMLGRDSEAMDRLEKAEEAKRQEWQAKVLGSREHRGGPPRPRGKPCSSPGCNNSAPRTGPFDTCRACRRLPDPTPESPGKGSFVPKHLRNATLKNGRYHRPESEDLEGIPLVRK